MAWISSFWDWMDATFGKYAATVLFTNSFAALFAAGLLRLCGRLAVDRNTRFHNYLVFCLGALVGWALGMFFVPYGTEDKPIFEDISKLASVFFSGYALSKLDRFLEATMFDEKKPKAESWVRMGLFCATAMLAILVVVTNRLYFRPDGARALTFLPETVDAVTRRYPVDAITDAVYVGVLRSGAFVRSQ
ncbi:hypothetical protein [Paraburkholderia caribensis]|uniref:hypothetical protein n=1 Tax=Paraburkholderia caribensis TaxID=75105 RepID=UPI0034D383D7